MADNPKLSQTQRETCAELPATKHELAATFDITPSSARDRIASLRNAGVSVTYNEATGEYEPGSPETYESGEIEEEAEDEYQPPSSPSDVSETLVNALRDGLTYEDFEEKFGHSESVARRVMSDLREMGYEVEFKTLDANGKRMYYIPEDGSNFYKAGDGDGTYKFAVISDTHLGSQATHLEELHDFYDRLIGENIDTVFHCGDISDGWEVHQGHINVIKGDAAGWGRLEDYVVENYPQRDGIDTFFIEGNHDNKFHRRTGIHFGKKIANRRDDLHYCGDCMARFVFDEENDIDLELLHPSGGKPYTVGYRLQTLYRERAEENKPTIGIVGHLHGSMYAHTEGVHGFYAGAWKGITTYGKRKGHEAKIGGWILELEIEDGEVRRLSQDWIGYEAEDTTDSYTRTELKELSG